MNDGNAENGKEYGHQFGSAMMFVRLGKEL